MLFLQTRPCVPIIVSFELERNCSILHSATLSSSVSFVAFNQGSACDIFSVFCYTPYHSEAGTKKYLCLALCQCFPVLLRLTTGDRRKVNYCRCEFVVALHFKLAFMSSVCLSTQHCYSHVFILSFLTRNTQKTSQDKKLVFFQPSFAFSVCRLEFYLSTMVV